MFQNIVFVADNSEMIQICVAWKKCQNVGEIAELLDMDVEFVSERVRVLRKAGVLEEGGRVDPDVDKYIETWVAAHIKKVKDGR